MPNRELTRRLLLRLVLPALGLGVFASVLLHLSGAGVPLWYTIALATLGIVVFVVGQAALYSIGRPDRPMHGPEYEPAQVLPMLGVIERRLSGATRDRRLFHAQLQPALYDLARERVRRHGGPDLGAFDDLRTSDSARQTLGDELWNWMIDRSEDGPALTSAQVTGMVNAIGRL